MTLAAIPKTRIFVLGSTHGFASIAAVSLVGVLSSHLWAGQASRRSPLREAYQFFPGPTPVHRPARPRSSAGLARPPALRLLVSLTLTAVRIFAIQLVLGNLGFCSPSLLSFSLCGPKFQRSARMFSAKHLRTHRPQGYSRTNTIRSSAVRSNSFSDICYGDLPELGRTVHVRSTIKRTADPTTMPPPWL